MCVGFLLGGVVAFVRASSFDHLVSVWMWILKSQRRRQKCPRVTKSRFFVSLVSHCIVFKSCVLLDVNIFARSLLNVSLHQVIITVIMLIFKEITIKLQDVIVPLVVCLIIYVIVIRKKVYHLRLFQKKIITAEG